MRVLSMTAMAVSLMCAACAASPEASPPTTAASSESTVVTTTVASTRSTATLSSPTTTLTASSTAAPTAAPNAAPTGDADELRIDTPCYTLDDGFEFPEASVEYVGYSSGPSGPSCDFLVQLEGLADTSVVIGEAFRDPEQTPYADMVEQVEDMLARGEELRSPMLQLMNSGPTGEPIEIVARETRSEPSEITVLWHVSERRRGAPAVTAIIDLPPGPDGASRLLVVWGLMIYAENVELVERFLDHLVIKEP